MEPQRGSAEARDGAGSESGQHHQQQQQHQWRHGEWDPVGRDTGVSATLLGPFGTMAEPLNGGTAGADAGVRDVLAKPPAAAATAEWPAATAPAANAAPAAAAAAAAAAAPAAGYMEMGAMNDFEILAHEKGDESDFSPMGVQPELEIPKDWMRDFVAKKEAFYKDASSAVPSGLGERFPTAGLSEVDLSRPAGSPRSDEDEPQIESCDSSPADDIVTEFPAPSALLAEGAVASLGGRGGPDAAGSPSGGLSDDKPPKKATSPDKPMEKLIFLAEEKYLETSAPQKRESSSPGDVETLTKHPRKEERVEARALHAGEKPSVVYHPGYSEAETISISQESSPLEEISPIADEFTDKLIAAGDEAQKKRQTSAEIEYSISLSQESSPGEDSSPVMGGMGRTFPKANVTATMQQQQRQQLSGADLSEEKQVPLAKKDNSLTSSYISSSTEESSSPGEEKSSAVDGGGTKVGGKEYFVEEVPRQAREVPGAKSGGGDEDKSPRVIATSTAAPREAGQTDPALAIESLGPSRGSMTNWYTEPPASLGDVSWRPAHGATAVGKSPEVAPTRGTGGGGGGWHAEEAPRETSLDTASILADFGAGNAKQQPPQQPKQQPQQPPPPPQQQPRAVATAGVTAFGMPTPSGVRVIDSDDDDDEEEEDDEDDDEYEREFYPEATLTSPWVDKNPVALAGKEEETKAKPGGATAAPGPLGPATTAAPRAVEPLAPQAAAVQPRAPLASPAAAAGPPAPSGVVAAATAAKEEEPKVFRPSQPPPSWSGFGPPTVIIEEAAEEGAAEREAPAPEARPRRVGAPADARQERGQQGKDEEKKEEKEEEGKKEEKKLPAKLEEGTPRLSLLDKVHMPSVSRLVYWREPRRSGAVLAALLLLLLSIAHLSVFTIVGYLGLLVLACTITWRVGRGVLCAVQKREDGHPFRAYLAEDVSVTRERMSRQVEAARVWTTSAATELRRLLLVQDLVDSLKFAGVLWLMTYVGSVFNGISLLILGVVLLFSVPIAYEKKKTEIDHYLALVQAKVDDATARVKNVIPAALRPNEPSSVAK